MDGHGPDGHFVSEFISEIIPSQLINHPEIKKLSKPEAIYKKFKENNCKIITQAFISADKKIQNMEFDTSESGCTCCLTIHIGKHIMCANTGDSRAIVVYDESNDINPKNLDFLNVTPLSIDSKPELPKEMNRIIAAGGEVSQLKDEFGEGVGPFRVWVKGKDYPGLAMSRSIGDLKGKKIGVIPDPGILEYELNETTKFIVVCSDGVWEFLKNETVMNIGKKYYLENKASEFSHELINEALKEWEKNESIVDDITSVVAFF
jgi:serine/threonine protein phosphatase PrpC